MRLATADEVLREHPSFGAKSTLYAMAAQNKIPHLRFARKHVRFDLDAIERWLESQLQGGESPASAA